MSTKTTKKPTAKTKPTAKKTSKANAKASKPAAKKAPAKPVFYKNIGAVLRAKQAGKLPRGFAIRIGTDASYALPLGPAIFDFSGTPKAFLVAVFKALGIATKD